jgi:phospholipid transport system substrate-binding protein
MSAEDITTVTFNARLSAALAFALVPAAAHAEANDPAARMAAYNNSVLEIMKQRLGLSARVDRFEELVRSYYDMPAIAALVVGPKWAASSADERQAATAALTHHSALSLARNFAKFGGERFIVDPNVASRDTSRIVRVTITSPGSRDTLLYRFRQHGGDWKIIDVISGGVSQLAVQRADLAGTVAAGGVAGLTRRLGQMDEATARQR